MQSPGSLASTSPLSWQEYVNSTNDARQSSPKRQRASRKGQPRRFICSHEGCDKRYSRAEHLARHKLNHTPKQVYHCVAEGCKQSFVRPDLFARHKRKHEDVTPSDSSLPSTRSAAEPVLHSSGRAACDASTEQHGLCRAHDRQDIVTEQMVGGVVIAREEHDAGLNSVVTPSFPIAQNLSCAPIRSNDDHAILPAFRDHHSSWLNSTDLGRTDNVFAGAQSNENFAAWLFDSLGSHNSGFDFTNVPFLDFGMEFASNDIWSLDDYATDVPNALGLTSMVSDPRSFETIDRIPHIYISEQRKEAIVAYLNHFMGRKRPRSDVFAPSDSILVESESGKWPRLTMAILKKCTAAFWRDVSTQMPIVHQPTFSASKCQPFLLLSEYSAEYNMY